MHAFYAGVKGLSGSSACRWYIDEDIPDINSFRSRFAFLKCFASRIDKSCFIPPLYYLLCSCYSLGDQFTPLAAYTSTGPDAFVPRVYDAPVEMTVRELNGLDPFENMVGSSYAFVMFLGI
jgi:hypothetical protein